MQLAGPIERDHIVVLVLEDQRRDLYFRQQVDNINVVTGRT